MSAQEKMLSKKRINDIKKKKKTKSAFLSKRQVIENTPSPVSYRLGNINFAL